MSKTIVIAGGAGYVGSALTAALLARGDSVRVFDPMWFGNNLTEHVNLEIHKTTVEDMTDMDLIDAHAVVFLAGLSNDPMAEFDPVLNFKANAASPAYLAWIAKRAGVPRFVYASSCSVYGDSGTARCSEMDRPNVNTPYGLSKLQGEHGCMAQDACGFSVIALRKGTASGHSPRMRFDLMINTMVRDAVTKQAVTVRAPEAWRPFLSVDDTVRAYIAAIDASDRVSGIFNIISGDASVFSIGAAVASAVAARGPCPQLFIDPQPGMRSYRATDSRARSELGYAGQSTVTSIVHQLLDRWESYGDVWAERYYNVLTFKRRAMSIAGQLEMVR